MQEQLPMMGLASTMNRLQLALFDSGFTVCIVNPAFMPSGASQGLWPQPGRPAPIPTTLIA